MMPIIETLLWCMLQVTLVGALGLVLCAVLRRCAQPASALVPAAALAIVVGLTLSAFLPWPRWWRLGSDWLPAGNTGGSSRQTVAAATGNIQPVLTAEDRGRGFPGGDSAWLRLKDAPEDTLPAANMPAAKDSFRSEPQGASAAVTAAASAGNGMNSILRGRWLAPTVLLLLGAGAALGLVRLVGGLIAVQAYRRASRPVADRPLAELIDLLRAELGIKQHVELRETDRLATAATVGWFTPVILLPPKWRCWSVPQQRAVLAHELAHVAHRDFLACVLAQFSLAIHFYHPLIHALAARLRLEQELAADATAAALSGGERTYLQSLAALALDESPRPLVWPARTFLPTQGTFLRRIEMLRDAKRISAGPRRRGALKWAAIGLLLLAAAAATGLRGGSSLSPLDQQAAAQDKDAADSGKGARSAAIDLTYVPNDAKMLLALRPAEMLAHEELRGILAQAAKVGPPVVRLLAGKEVVQLTMVGPAGVEADDWTDQAIVILQFAQSVNVDDLAESWELKLTELSAAGGAEAADAPGHMSYVKPNEKTVILGQAPQLARYMASRRKGKPLIAAGEGWEKVSQGALVAALDMQAIRDEIAKEGPPRGRISPELGAVAPLWQDTEYLAAGVTLEDNQIRLQAVATCHDQELAASVAKTANAAFILAGNAMRNSRERNKDVPAFVTLMFDTAEKLLKEVQVDQTQTLVIAQTGVAIPDVKSEAGASLLGAITEARGAAQRVTSANNLKQIMIAMHNWADAHGGMFPPPVIFGKDGKGTVPHSWRVELLPYLEQAALYEQYHFDQPWDSPANKAVLAKMPAVFRHPSEDEDSTSSSYFVLRPETLLEKNPEGGLPTAFSKASGVRFADITDGTSYTLAVVEAKRDTPWTKPDDIVFDPAFAKPAIESYTKDGFQAGFCDGAVKFISNKVEPRTLQLLITPQDGNPVEIK